tara:strand:- start:170 stop:346 length:177 start_codon:yes stop_codon:yes gene_type:complete
MRGYIDQYKKYKKFKDNLEKRIVELRSKIITDACFEGKVDKVTTELFLKYNEMLRKLI